MSQKRAAEPRNSRCLDGSFGFVAHGADKPWRTARVTHDVTALGAMLESGIKPNRPAQ